VAADDRVITQGEVGDQFFIIERGSFRVSRDGQPTAELGPGDCFGEVALLLDEPRNATVEAVSRGELWVLGRDDFVEAVTGTPRAESVARGIAEQRR
jgi:CRP-like cAMP-binding protein